MANNNSMLKTCTVLTLMLGGLMLPVSAELLPSHKIEVAEQQQTVTGTIVDRQVSPSSVQLFVKRTARQPPSQTWTETSPSRSLPTLH